jgi:hypothetical protein
MKTKTLSPAVRVSTLFAILILSLASMRTSAQSSSDSAAAAQSPKTSARITQAVDETRLVQPKGNVHALARTAFDQGPVSDATPMKRMQLLLKRSPEQQAALAQLMAEQMSKESPNFHKWLTPQEFGQQFGPVDADINAVSGWLGSRGFTDIRVSPSRVTIEFSGNAGMVRGAFHTDIHHFLVDGEVKQANTSDPQFPAALSPVVSGVVSLHNFNLKSMRQTKGLYKRTADGKIVPQFTGTNNDFFAVGPADFAKIYNVPAALDGTGGKIAIIGFSEIDPADVDAFRTLFSLPAKNLNIVLNGADPGFNAEEGEAALDVQSSGAVAQKAQIDYILSEGTLTSDPLFLGAEYVIFSNTDDVMSLSFGGCEASNTAAANQFIDTLWEEAAAQGITVVVSAGDGGTAGCDNFNTQTTATGGIAVSGLASTPFNVAVGGTDFDDVGNQAAFWNQNPGANGAGRLSVKGYIHEVPWNDSCASTATPANLTTCAVADNIVAGSGGPSILYPRPAFQGGLVPNGILASDAANHRYLPDISLFASDGQNSLSFYVECEADAGASCVPDPITHTFTFQGVGGTSVSAPSFAGILALVGQSEFNAGRSRRLGNANLVLYNLAATAANSCNSTTTPLTGSATCVFYDVTKGNNSVPCSGGSLNCSSATAGTNGVLVTVNGATKTPAFTAVAGFDLATGLGTPNVTNLASKWHTATLTATTTATKVNGVTTTVTINHGASVTLTGTVTAGAGTPTGDVSFLAPTARDGGVDFHALAAGVATVTTSFLPGGSYNIKAHYGGDTSFAPSDDPTGVPVVVHPEASKLQMAIVTNTTVGVTTVPFGSPYILRFDILNSTNTACQPAVAQGVTTGCAFDATGTVTVTDNTVPLGQGTFNVNSEGSSEDQTIDLTGGNHTLSGTYSGDISYAPPAAATVLSVMVTKATTATALSGAATVAVNTPIALTATISSQSGSLTGATGTVTFSNNGTAIGSPIAVTPVGAGAAGAGGIAVLTTTFATAGNQSVTATYNGDGNYATSSASAFTVTVTAASPTITNLSPTTVVAGSGAFTLRVKGTNFVNGAVVNFGGVAKTTTFTDSANISAAILAADVATAGQIPVTVTNPAGGGTSAQSFFSVTAPTGTFTVTVPAGAQVITAGNTLMVPVTVTPAGGFTGGVTVNCTNLPPGVTCNGGAAFVINVTNANPAIGQLPIAVLGPSTVLTASAMPERDALPNGARKGLVMVGAGTGFAALFLLFLPGRKRLRAALGLGLVCVISLVLGCGGGYGGGGGTNNPVPTVSSVMPTSATAGGQGFTLTVNGTNFVNGSVVNFGGAAKTTSYGSTTQLTAAITAADIANAAVVPVTVTNPTPGGGTSNSVNFTVNAAAVATTTKITLTPPAKVPTGVNDVFVFNVAVTGGSTPTGNIQLLDGGANLGPVTALTANGTLMITQNGLIPVGTHAISAAYKGDSGHLTSSSGAINCTVTGQTQVTIAAQGATNGNQTLNVTIQ